MNKRRVNKWYMLLLASLPISGVLADDAGMPVNDAKETPSLELLEFLGSWETEDGEWVDPINLLEEIEAEPQTAKKEEQHDG